MDGETGRRVGTSTEGSLEVGGNGVAASGKRVLHGDNGTTTTYGGSRIDDEHIQIGFEYSTAENAADTSKTAATYNAMSVATAMVPMHRPDDGKQTPFRG